MNYADFSTNPDGFPMESDATLGFMQSAYLDGLRALMALAGNDNVIVSGVEVTGGVASDGWIIFQGDLVKFVGGSVQNSFYISETAIPKNNENGQAYNRYFYKSAQFGTGTIQGGFSSLRRAFNHDDFKLWLEGVATLGDTTNETWVVLNGLQPSVGGGIDSGIAMRNNVLISVNAYTATNVDENNPVYLTSAGEWTLTASSSHLKFEPKTSKRIEYLHRKRAASVGQIIWVSSAQIDPVDFDGTLGKWQWEGFRAADGTFSTVDLTSAITGLVALQRV